MPSSVVWLSRNSFSLRSELSVEVTSVTVWPTLIWPLEFEGVAGRLAQQFHGDRQFVAEALRGAGQGLAVDREVGDEAVLAVGAFLGRIADVEHRRR